MSQHRILIADDEQVVREGLAGFLRGKGYEVECVDSGAACLEVVQTRRFDLLFLDLRMRGQQDGFDVLQSIRGDLPETYICILTAFDELATRRRAEALGADAFIGKTFDPNSMYERVKLALSEVDRRILRRFARPEEGLHELVGNSPAMRRVFDAIQRVASADVSVLIRGETGTGKELVARAIHRESKRAQKPFVAVNCAAIPQQLLESEIFGHVRGAFTGAATARMGTFEAANGGTLFLDEISKGSLDFQAKMLRVLDRRTFTRVGSTQEASADVRLLVASNADLQVLIQKELFLPDLYYRVNVMSIVLPPLRERQEDIPLLLEHFVGHFSQLHARPIRQIPDTILRKFQAYSYPGNVREIRNLAERAVMLSDGGDLKDPFGETEGMAPSFSDLFQLPLKQARDQFDQLYLERLLERTQGNRAKAARIAQIDQATLFRTLQKAEKAAREKAAKTNP